MLGLWLAQTQSAPAPSFTNAPWYVFGVGVIVIFGLLWALRITWNEKESYKADNKALVKEDQEMFGQSIAVTEQSIAAHKESRKAIERLTDTIDDQSKEIASLRSQVSELRGRS